MQFENSTKDKLFHWINYTCILLLSLTIIYPFYYVIINSVNGNLVYGPVYLFPKDIIVTYYGFIFNNDDLFNSFLITVSRTLIGVVFNVFLLAMCAYALRKRELTIRNLYLVLFTITMFFDGGLIPKFMTLKALGMLDTFSVYIFPEAFRFFIVIIFMSSFNNIPESIEESAKIDGANDFTIFWRFYLFLSLPVVATMALFEAVRHWNMWFDSVYFTTSRELQTMQAVLVKLIKQSSAQEYLGDMESSEEVINPTGITYATMVVTLLPITMVYPFLQRFFIKGITVGSVKG